ncbi:MAG: hypothetical protein JOZ13_17360 [Alphaproteobacteria bacterium]|nr:hypothetical protein [Alphaproteobacteria bacterium]
MLKKALLAGMALCVSTGWASASQDDVKRFYDAARLCYVANGDVYSAFKRNGDTANASLFDKKAHTAYDLAYLYGDMLHLSRQEIAADIKATTDTELPKLVQDSAYLTAVAKDCKGKGMM